MMNTTLESCTSEMPYGYQPSFKGIYIAIEVVIAILAVVGNLLVCLAVTWNKRLRTVTNYFLVSLAIADILVGLVGVPCAVLTDLGRPHHNLPLCLVLLSILMVLTQSSILSLLAVAAERYVAILMPFQYRRMMSSRNAWLALLITWTLGACTGMVPLMDWRHQPADSNYCIFTCVVDMKYLVYFNFFFCLLVPLVVMFIMYGHIFITVRSQLRRIAVTRGATEIKRVGVGGSGRTEAGSVKEGTADQTSGSSGIGETVTGGSVRQEHQAAGRVGVEAGSAVLFNRNSAFQTSGIVLPGATPTTGFTTAQPSNSNKAGTRIHRELRKATSLFLVLFLFMVCWIPIHCINCVLLLCPQCPVPMSLTLWAILLSHSNSAINPLLYAYSMRSFRHTLARMCRCHFRPKQQEPQ